jgi:DNA polymerase V
VAVFSSGYPSLYGNMSRRVIWHLGQVALGVETYPIDETFLYLVIIKGLIKRGPTVFAPISSREHTSILTCVGVALTKTLAGNWAYLKRPR